MPFQANGGRTPACCRLGVRILILCKAVEISSQAALFLLKDSQCYRKDMPFLLVGIWQAECGHLGMRDTAGVLPQQWNSHPDNGSTFENEFQEGFGRTVRFLHSRGARSDLAEEIAQAAWARGWERRNQLQSSESIVSWVNGIAKNMFRNIARTLYRTVPLNVTSGPCSNISRGRKALDLEAQVDIRRVFQGEDECDGLILRLFYEEGYATQEIAARLGLSAVAVRIRLCRLRRRIRELFGVNELQEA